MTRLTLFYRNATLVTCGPPVYSGAFVKGRGSPVPRELLDHWLVHAHFPHHPLRLHGAGTGRGLGIHLLAVGRRRPRRRRWRTRRALRTACSGRGVESAARERAAV